MAHALVKTRKALTIGEVADRLQLEARAVYGLIKRGQLEARKVGRAWRVSLKALDRYLNGRESEYDNEPLSTKDLAAIRRGLADIKAGRTITREELNRKYGLCGSLPATPAKGKSLCPAGSSYAATCNCGTTRRGSAALVWEVGAFRLESWPRQTGGVAFWAHGGYYRHYE